MRQIALKTPGGWCAKDESQVFGRWVTTPMRDEAGQLREYAQVLRDKTERRRTEEQIRASLAEKHALLQEIHHRVKNNLQVITNLLSIQAARLENPDVAAVLAETENRVRAIAALHETLYSSDNLAHIEFGSYVQQLVRGRSISIASTRSASPSLWTQRIWSSTSDRRFRWVSS